MTLQNFEKGNKPEDITALAKQKLIDIGINPIPKFRIEKEGDYIKIQIEDSTLTTLQKIQIRDFLVTKGFAQK